MKRVKRLPYRGAHLYAETQVLNYGKARNGRIAFESN